MDLRTAAAYFEGTSFDTYDEGTAAWTLDAFYAKLAPVDRFLSNFHRPTHRRMLGIDPSVSLPASNTIRLGTTGDVYIIGQVRGDDRDDYEYDNIGISHLVTSTVEIHRRAPTGPSSNPGWLVDSTVGTHYADLEFRASVLGAEQHDSFDDEFFVILPPHADLQEWDFIVRGTETYQVKSSYIDSGFRFGRCVQRSDVRRDFVYLSRGAGFGYDPDTGVTGGLTAYNVTGFARNLTEEEVNYATITPERLKLVVRRAHIGITPKIDDQVIWEGITYEVRGVNSDPAFEEWEVLISL